MRSSESDRSPEEKAAEASRLADEQQRAMSGGSEGYLGEGFVNIPLSERAAIRLVGWARHDGGFVDNIPYTRPYPSSGIVPDNSKLVEDDYNDVDTYGARAALRFDINDSWTVTPTVMGQVQESNGIFGYDRTLKDYQVAHARPEQFKDSWMQAALTVEGKVWNFDLVYAGAYMFRDIDGESDYQDYTFWYDELFGSGAYWYDNNDEYMDPTQYIQSQDNFVKQSHELRLSSPQDQRWNSRSVSGAGGITLTARRRKKLPSWTNRQIRSMICFSSRRSRPWNSGWTLLR